MMILALEFSPQEKSTAVLMAGEVHGFAIDRTFQATRPFELIQSVLEQASICPMDVECIAVGLGPGSYAGIRIAIAVAQGWQLARGVRLLGVSSAEAIARKVNAPEGFSADRRTPSSGVLNIVFDAQREQACAIRYQIGADPFALGGFDLLTSDEEMRRRESGEIFIKADVGPWRLGDEIVIPSDAHMIGLIASQRTAFLSGVQLEPAYLRKAEFVKASPPRFRP